jgi:hypothetical protein
VTRAHKQAERLIDLVLFGKIGTHETARDREGHEQQETEDQVNV